MRRPLIRCPSNSLAAASAVALSPKVTNPKPRLAPPSSVGTKQSLISPNLENSSRNSSVPISRGKPPTNNLQPGLAFSRRFPPPDCCPSKRKYSRSRPSSRKSSAMKVALPDGPLANKLSASLPHLLPELFNALAP